MDRVELVARELARMTDGGGWRQRCSEAERFIAAWDALMSVHAMATEMSRRTTESGPVMLPITADAAGLVYLALSLAPGGTTHSVVEVREALISAAKALAK